LAPRRSARLDRCVEESSKIKQLFPYWNWCLQPQNQKDIPAGLGGILTS
jgi:hypothetical protein